MTLFTSKKKETTSARRISGVAIFTKVKCDTENAEGAGVVIKTKEATGWYLAYDKLVE
jgi:hypothetical protein